MALLARQETWADRVGHTPMHAVDVGFGNIRSRLLLKDESANPGGSIKDRTAVGLIREGLRGGRLKPGGRMIESTSGNLGAALACLALELGVHFTAVVDPKTTAANIEKMKAAGAEVVCIDRLDKTGGYLLSRLDCVEERQAADPDLFWPNQYESVANPAQHFISTGPEIWMQTEGQLDALCVAVSTGGTLVGVSRFMRRVSPRTRIVAVDARGSIALGGAPGTRLLTGIGASRPSSFANPADFDEVAYVTDAEAFGVCRGVRQATGLGFGGSAGAAIHAGLQVLRACPDANVVCLCPDGAGNYLDTIFDDAWIAARTPSARMIAEAVEGLLSPAGQRIVPFQPKTRSHA